MTALIFCACPPRNDPDNDTVRYTITTVVSSECTGMGTVTGGGTFDEGQSTIIQALANSGYQFVKWDDGNTEATRTIVVTQNKTYTACFAADQPSSSLIGTWMDTDDSEYDSEWVVFYEDGTGFAYYCNKESSGIYHIVKEETEAFNYSYNKYYGQLTLNYGGEYERILRVVELTSNKLVIQWEDEKTGNVKIGTSYRVDPLFTREQLTEYSKYSKQ